MYTTFWSVKLQRELRAVVGRAGKESERSKVRGRRVQSAGSVVGT